MTKSQDKTAKTIYSMMVENTGVHLLDSGGAYGRHWERNQGKTLQDFLNSPSVLFSVDKWGDKWGYEYTVNTFHYLNNQLYVDDLCSEFNSMSVDDWDSEWYGVSKAGQAWLVKQGFSEGGSVNTYNGDSALSQVVQYTILNNDDLSDTYLLVQVHGGCDVRGGYTDAKLFLCDNGLDGYLDERVYGTIDGRQVSNWYDGYTLRYDGDDDPDYEQEIKVGKDTKGELYIQESY